LSHVFNDWELRCSAFSAGRVSWFFYELRLFFAFALCISSKPSTDFFSFFLLLIDRSTNSKEKKVNSSFYAWALWWHYKAESLEKYALRQAEPGTRQSG